MNSRGKLLAWLSKCKLLNSSFYDTLYHVCFVYKDLCFHCFLPNTSLHFAKLSTSWLELPHLTVQPNSRIGLLICRDLWALEVLVVLTLDRATLAVPSLPVCMLSYANNLQYLTDRFDSRIHILSVSREAKTISKKFKLIIWFSFNRRWRILWSSLLRVPPLSEPLLSFAHNLFSLFVFRQC